jgi:type I restriction enzyme, S subunit
MENWKKIEIGSVAKINKASLTEKTSSDYEFFYIDIASVNNGKITFPTEKIQFKNAPSRARRIVQKDDILMATVRPNLQSFAHFSFEKDNVIASTGFAVLRANEKIDSKFLYYSIFSEHISKQVSLLIAGSNYPAINSSEVANLIIYLPSNLPEQKKIAAILSTWDSAIETTAKLIAAKQVRKRALMQRLLTGKQRFPQFVGQAWETLKIGDIAKEVSAKNSKDNQLTVLSCTKHKGLVDSLSYFGKRIFSENLSTYKIVKRGQFAYATNHIEEGSIGYQNLYDEALISPMYTVFESNKKVNDSFLYKILKTETYRLIFEAMTSGSINRRGSLRWNGFKLIKIKLPSLEEQKRIAEVLETCDAEISLHQKELASLKEQKRGLMQQLLTGKVRVKVEGE